MENDLELLDRLKEWTQGFKKKKRSDQIFILSSWVLIASLFCAAAISDPYLRLVIKDVLFVLMLILMGVAAAVTCKSIKQVCLYTGVWVACCVWVVSIIMKHIDAWAAVLQRI